MITQKQRLKHLLNIRRAICMSRGGYSPVFPLVSVGLIIGAFTGYFLCHAILLVRFDFFFVVAVSLCYGAAGYLLTKYKSWDVYIYEKLAEYDPLDLGAYGNLQILAGGEMLDYTLIREWEKTERSKVLAQEIGVKVDTLADQARKTFASKQLNTQSQD